MFLQYYCYEPGDCYYVAHAAADEALIQEARNKGMLIDATHARKTKAAVVMDTDHIVLAAISAETIARRLDASRGEASFKSGVDEEGK
jgi:regulator of extracellular matrix RemA (YlzA/DUF370 family)